MRPVGVPFFWRCLKVVGIGADLEVFLGGVSRVGSARIPYVSQFSSTIHELEDLPLDDKED
jgi:hypothetical protein